MPSRPLMAGDITMALADAGPASVGLQSGRVKALAVTSAQRMKDLVFHARRAGH